MHIYSKVIKFTSEITARSSYGNASRKILQRRHFLSVTGFTLLEILIVVVIISILAGLAIPKFNKTVESAKGKEAVVNLELIRTAERMYYLDYNTYTVALPPWDPLVPAYLPENPNANPNRNWDYSFSPLMTQPRPIGNFFAQRRGGIYSAQFIGMDFNGNLMNNAPCVWPWPPN